MLRITAQRALRSVLELPSAAAAAFVGPQEILLLRRRSNSSGQQQHLPLPRCISSNILRSTYDDVPITNVSFSDFIFQNFEQFGDHEALVCGISGRSYTYDMVYVFSRKLGTALANRGLRKGDVVALICPNIPEFAIAFLGIVCVGGTVTTVNPTYTPHEIARQLQDSNSKFVITVAPLAEKTTEAVSQCPMVEEVFSLNDAEGCTSLLALATEVGEKWVECPKMNPMDDVLVMPYSSGTTGLPKGVMLTHQNVCTNILQMSDPQMAAIPKPSETVLGILPFFHCYAMTSVMALGLHYGARIITLPRFETDTFLSAIHQHKPTVMHLVPRLVNLLASSSDVDVDAMENLHTIVCGAAPLSGDVVAKLLKRFHPQPIVFQEGYGMTELSPVTHVSPKDSGRIGTCGVLVPNTEAKVVDISTGVALGAGAEGELCVRGPQVMKGYLNNPRATRETIDCDGWLHTGDIVTYDEDGYFHIIDRLKELIKVKGLQVAPSELEHVLLAHPDVEDVAVIGVPDDMAGELPKAYIVPRNSRLTKEELLVFTQDKLAPHKQLKGGIEFVTTIPKTQTGKISRRELREQNRATKAPNVDYELSSTAVAE